MRIVLFAFAVVCFATSILFADAWNQPQIDKATAFQQQFGGSARASTEETTQSSKTSTGVYIAIGLGVFLLIGGAIIATIQIRKKSQTKPIEDTEEE